MSAKIVNPGQKRCGSSQSSIIPDTLRCESRSHDGGTNFLYIADTLVFNRRSQPGCRDSLDQTRILQGLPTKLSYSHNISFDTIQESQTKQSISRSYLCTIYQIYQTALLDPPFATLLEGSIAKLLWSLT